MTVHYVPRKKTDKSGGESKELYYAVPKALQKKGEPVTERNLADRLARNSSLTPGDALSTLSQLPREIADQLKEGRTVNIKGLGTFYLAISSRGVENPQDCKPSTINSVRVCFRADKELKQYMMDCDFESLELTQGDR